MLKTAVVYKLRRIKAQLFLSFELLKWKKRLYQSPLPAMYKRAFLNSVGTSNACWIETGTYKGETSFYLAQNAKSVITIEPDPKLFAAAKKRLSGARNVTVLQGKSEDRFNEAIALAGSRVNFFLDGHASGGETHHAENSTPLRFELATISAHLNTLEKVVVIIDDIRLCRQNIFIESGYPNLDFLVHWASENKMEWYIENDMFVARYNS